MGRRTIAQSRAFTELWSQFGLAIESGWIDMAQVFQRESPCFLEIGFGLGHSLLALSKNHPDKNFIGIEAHTPGIGALFLGMQAQQIKNVRVFHADAYDVFEQCITLESLQGIHVFFPDPWPKRRHHQRRLIQKEFINLILPKLKKKGQLHIATDWEDYAKQMLKVLSEEVRLINLAGAMCFAERSFYRPIATKFEKRAEREGRSVWELQFEKV